MAHVPIIKNPPKIKFNKFVKLKVILMPAAIRQILNYVVQAMIGNGTFLNLKKLEWKNL